MSALTYLDLLFGAEPDGNFAEVRFKLRSGGMGQDFAPVRDRERLVALLEARGRTTDVYMGVAPRVRQEGGRDAVERVHCLWVDCDDETAVAALEGFEPAPSMVIHSGSGRHAYWSLWPPMSPDEAEGANRRLAHALGADMRATDAARILRPPGTLNFKTDPPGSVEVERTKIEVYALEQVVGKLPDPLPEHVPRPPVRLPTATDDPLLTIPPPVYVEALTALEIGRDGKVCCPFHDDSTPSLHVYDEAEHGWHCFGCGRGGTIIDFGAALYGLEPRGQGFHEIRRRLDADLMAVAA